MFFNVPHEKSHGTLKNMERPGYEASEKVEKKKLSHDGFVHA